MVLYTRVKKIAINTNLIVIIITVRYCVKSVNSTYFQSLKKKKKNNLYYSTRVQYLNSLYFFRKLNPPSELKKAKTDTNANTFDNDHNSNNSTKSPCS